MQRQVNSSLQTGLLRVRGLLHRNFCPYAELLAAEYQPTADWLNRELVPTLILLPSVCTDNVCRDKSTFAGICNLALAMELSFLANRVHDLCAAGKKPETTDSFALTASSRAILVGDYLYTLAAMRIAESGYNQWLARIGRTICRRSEARLARLRWPSRPYVTEAEKLANLHKEQAEGLALAAEMSLAELDWPENERQAWTEFGFYVGLAQGILLEFGNPTEAVEKAGQILQTLPPKLQTIAQTNILAKLASCKSYQREEYEQAYK